MDFKFTNGNLTQLVENNYWEDLQLEMTEDAELPLQWDEYVRSFENENLLADGIQRYVSRISPNDTSLTQIKKLIQANCEKEQIPGLSDATLNNWMRSGKVGHDDSSRKNVYKLCFALGMNVYDTAEFFLKSYLERPFNCKNIDEAGFFFCMNTGRKYADAIRIIDKIKSFEPIESQERQRYTIDVRNDIRQIVDEGCFLEYMKSNLYSFAQQNVSAKAKINQLLAENKELSKKILNDDVADYEITQGEFSNDDLLNIILGRPAYKYEEFENMAKADLPETITRNFPDKQRLHNILNDKNPSKDSIRKMIILLHFYNFFAHASANGIESSLYDEYVDDLDLCLEACGYLPHYWRNPYDWLFGYCASRGGQELDALRVFVDKYAGIQEE